MDGNSNIDEAEIDFKYYDIQGNLATNLKAHQAEIHVDPEAKKPLQLTPLRLSVN